MDTLFATKDKKAEAEQRFQKTLFKRDTESAWQAYTASQSRAIADMAWRKRRFTCLWEYILGQSSPSSRVPQLGLYTLCAASFGDQPAAQPSQDQHDHSSDSRLDHYIGSWPERTSNRP